LADPSYFFGLAYSLRSVSDLVVPPGEHCHPISHLSISAAEHEKLIHWKTFQSPLNHVAVALLALINV
jgi:hypothetical protein